MAKFLIHIHSGPDLKNKAKLGMLVAITAFNKGNEVNCSKLNRIFMVNYTF